METLIVIDAKMNFQRKEKDPVPNFQSAGQVISKRVEKARSVVLLLTFRKQTTLKYGIPKFNNN